MIDKRSTKAYKLEKENKRLIELCNKYEEEHKTAFKLWTIKMEEIPTYEEKIEMQNEIERLNENNQAYQKELCKVWEERDNAYRIINELEKWLREDTETYMITMETGRAFNMFDILDKLQELKGSDKE